MFVEGVSPYRKPYAPEGINFSEKHHLVGFQWPYINCNGKEYKTTMTPTGWVCDCPGFNFHGKCKHITKVHKRLVA
jgi:hypothetical protein